MPTAPPNALTSALLAGETALERGELDEAAKLFAKALALAPTDVNLGLALANVYRLAGRPGEQIALLRQLHSTGNWSAVGVAHTLGGALLEAGEAVRAVRCFEHVLGLASTDPAAMAALAAARRATGDANGAWPQIQKALALAPKEGAFHLTAAQVRHDLGDLPGALRWLHSAAQLRPQHGPTKVQRAYTTLLRGPSKAGWEAFEARPLPVPATAAKPWQGEPLNGRSILVTAEQGIGDLLQFLRFVPRLAAEGAGRVVVECHGSLMSLLSSSGFEVLPRGEPCETELHVPMLSLPYRLGLDHELDVEVLPLFGIGQRSTRANGGAGGGIGADDNGKRAVRRIGLVWSGNPVFAGRATRDLDAALLPGIVAIPDVEWVSLQQGDAGDQDIDGLTRLPPFADWRETATMLATLDGLVTTDTGIAHLAGSMGIAVWMLLAKVPDWRWGLSGSQSAWYPSASLIRQVRPGDWEGVISRLATSLSAATEQ